MLFCCDCHVLLCSPVTSPAAAVWSGVPLPPLFGSWCVARLTGGQSTHLTLISALIAPALTLLWPCSGPTPLPDSPAIFFHVCCLAIFALAPRSALVCTWFFLHPPYPWSLFLVWYHSAQSFCLSVLFVLGSVLLPCWCSKLNTSEFLVWFLLNWTFLPTVMMNQRKDTAALIAVIHWSYCYIVFQQVFYILDSKLLQVE